LLCGAPLYDSQGSSGIIAFTYTDLSHATTKFSEQVVLVLYSEKASWRPSGREAIQGRGEHCCCPKLEREVPNSP
jgi:hypothetical protein